MLVNSNGNALVVTFFTGNYVQVEVYASVAKVGALNPNFEKPDVFGLDVPGITEALKATDADSSGDEKIWDNIILAIETRIVYLVANPPVPGPGPYPSFPTRDYPHNWAFPA